MHPNDAPPSKECRVRAPAGTKLAASAWEFRYRFWIFGGWFSLSFFAGYQIDRRNLAFSIAAALCGLAHHEPTDAAVRAVLFGGVLLAVLAAALRTWATGYIGAEVMVDGALRTHTVIAEGPYRYVRNPLYLGTNLLAAGYSAMASRLGGIMLIAGIVLFHYRLILREERGLTQAQGERYERYRRAVPRLWPALRPRAAGSHRQPDWSAGFRGEMFFWGLAAALLVFTITLNLRVYFLALGLAFGAYFLCLRIVRRRRPSGA